MATKSTKSASGKEPQTMEELLALSGINIKSFKQGERIKAKFIETEGNTAFFDVGGKSEGIVTGLNFEEVKDYIKTLKKGDEVESIVLDPESREGVVRLSLRHTAADSLWERLEHAYEEDLEIEVVGRSAGDKGITVDIDNTLTGFIPSSQLGHKLLDNPESVVGKSFPVKVIELDRDRKRVVLSEKEVSEAEEIALHKVAIESVPQGEVLKGKVTQITNFGAFVEVTTEVAGDQMPVEGLVHISELAWQKVDHPSAVVAVGDEVEVMAIGIKDDKLALSVKQAKKDPWENIEEKYTTDKRVKGKVVRLSNFGAFVELEPGVEGLVHLTKIPPGTTLAEGQEVDTYIEEVDTKDHRISLGLILTAKPVGYK